MFCTHCHTPFEIVSVIDGKSKYCKKCGNLIYKKEHNSIVIFDPIEPKIKTDEELELRESIIREKEYRYKEQLERKQKEQEFRERLEQERLIKEKEAALKKQKELEVQERLFLLELEIQEKLKTEKTEQERLIRLEIENQKIIREQFQAEQFEKEKGELEKLKLAAVEKSRIELEQKVKSEKETAHINLPVDNNQNKTVVIKNSQSYGNNWTRYVLPVLGGVLLTLFFLYFKDKISGLSKSVKTKTVLASADTNSSSAYILDLNSDSALLEQLKSNMTGKEILSWNTIKMEEIKNISILNFNKDEDNTQYEISIDLDDKRGTKASAELSLLYNKIILEKIEIIKITYRNIAPVNAWFSFTPVANCTISVNTNSNPIQVKFCDDCSITKMVSNADEPKQIDNTSNIYIKSDNKHEALVEFSYVPVNINQ